MLKIFTVIFCVICVFSLTQCYSSQNGFKSITVRSELCHYSFEYSTYYKQDGPRTDLENIIPSTDLKLVAPEINEKSEVLDPVSGKIETVIGRRSPAAISIEVYDPSKYESAPQTSQERLERTITGNASWANFKLLERSPTTVSGVEGEMIVYLVDRLMPIPVEDGKNLDYVRAIYFDYDNLIWVIEAKCNQEIMEQVKADFDHVIQTFKILK